MNLGDITRRVQRTLGDDVGVLISTADILDWTLEAEKDIAKKTQGNQQTFNIPVVAGTESYELDSDILTFERATFDGRRLNKTSLQDLEIQDPDRGVSQATGGPTHFYVWNRTVYLYPIPSTAGELRIWVNILPAEIDAYNAATVPETPDKYHDSIVWYCLARAKERDEDWAASDRFAIRYETSLGEIIENEANPMQDSYPSIRPVAGDEW